MKKTCPRSRLVSSAARSPGRSSTGPDVPRMRDAQLGGDDVRERRLAEPGRAVEQHVVEHVAARARGGDLHAQVLAHVLLADVLVERPRPQRRLDEEILLERLGARPGSAGGAPCLAPRAPGARRG